jgi:hypothetical protein
MKDIVELMAELNNNVNDNREEVNKLTKELTEGHRILARKRLWIIITFTSVLLDIALTTILAVVGFNQVSVSNNIHKSQLNSCAMSNIARHNQIILWKEVKNVFVTPKTTPNSVKAFDNIIQYVKDHQKPIDCAKLYKK